MRPTRSSPAEPAAPGRAPDDAAFTVTEMAASLVVAAMLISSLAEITRQFARTTVRVRAQLEEVRGARVAQAGFAVLERADDGGLSVTSDSVRGTVGRAEARFQVSQGPDGVRRLTWETSGGGALRSIPIPADARFERDSGGVVRLWALPEAPPLLLVEPARETPFDCRYDVVARACR